jgi:hypothetical protein
MPPAQADGKRAERRKNDGKNPVNFFQHFFQHWPGFRLTSQTPRTDKKHNKALNFKALKKFPGFSRICRNAPLSDS